MIQFVTFWSLSWRSPTTFEFGSRKLTIPKRSQTQNCHRVVFQKNIQMNLHDFVFFLHGFWSLKTQGGKSFKTADLNISLEILRFLFWDVLSNSCVFCFVFHMFGSKIVQISPAFEYQQTFPNIFEDPSDCIWINELCKCWWAWCQSQLPCPGKTTNVEPSF